MRLVYSSIFSIFVLSFNSLAVHAQLNKKGNYNDLINLHNDLRKLEQLNLPNGVPDYRAITITKKQQVLLNYRKRLAAIDTANWPVEQKVDWALLQTEMNGLDFNCRVLKPWQRDPAFYAIVFAEQSDVPAHEGPTSHAAIDLWQLSFPLTNEAAAKLAAQLSVIPPLYQQAKQNLTGNARDLWKVGTGEVKAQAAMLDELSAKVGTDNKELNNAISEAKKSINDLVAWLEKELPKKNGPSGIGKENYTWQLQHVTLVPMTWDDEVTLLKRELARAYASLQLEKAHNKNIPPLKPFDNAATYNEQNDLGLKQLISFLRDKQVLPVKDYMEPELRKHLGSFLPEEKRNFFANINHNAPAIMHSHATHWFEIARMTYEPHPSPFRKDALPFNIWMSRSEGLATSMEETLMHAGLWDDNPHARELVWIMLAQRCARGLASLYAQANMINYDEARKFQIEWTPKGWTGDTSLVGFEQHLYLRQPGYGTCYVTGKYLIEHLMMDVSRQQQNDFTLYHFFDAFYNAGIIPVSLVRWQMTGMNAEVKKLLNTGAVGK